jgi:hypothetical protein
LTHFHDELPQGELDRNVTSFHKSLNIIVKNCHGPFNQRGVSGAERKKKFKNDEKPGLSARLRLKNNDAGYQAPRVFTR